MIRYMQLVLLLGLMWGIVGCGANRLIETAISTSGQPSTSVARGLAGFGTLEGFERVNGPRTFQFPADLGPQKAYKTEWWYYSGTLESADGRRFGYHVTFFRQGFAPASEPRDSTWATTDAYLAHLSIASSDGTHVTGIRAQRGGSIGLAGATASPFRVAIDNWSVAGSLDQVDLQAKEDNSTGLQLRLTSQNPPVLQGEQGYAKKGSQPGNATYYFSLPRMQTEGTLLLNGERIAVRGVSWFDREWGTSQLDDKQVGWDWFALHLDDQDLMWYQLRHADGTISPTSSGTLVRPDVTTRQLHPEDVVLKVEQTWTSPATGAVYPSAWRLQIPSEQIDVRLVPLIPNQEFALGYRYWEGAVTITGTMGSKQIDDTGYIELTGYADATTK